MKTQCKECWKTIEFDVDWDSVPSTHTNTSEYKSEIEFICEHCQTQMIVTVHRQVEVKVTIETNILSRGTGNKVLSEMPV